MSENESDRPFMWYQNICSALFGFVTKHACNRRTNRRTDRITTSKTALAQLRRAVNRARNNSPLHTVVHTCISRTSIDSCVCVQTKTSADYKDNIHYIVFDVFNPALRQLHQLQSTQSLH